MILDTTFVIDVMRGDSAAAEKLQSLIDRRTPLTLTTPTIFELFSGLAQSSKPAIEIEKIHRVLHQQARWPLDDTSAERGGRIFGELVKRGQPIDPIDAMIAGIGLEHQEPILTRNTKDFSKITGLTINTY